MKLQGKNAIALILILSGGLILLGKLGPVLGWIVGLIVPILLIAFGYIGIKNGKKVLGTALLIFGVVVLLGKMSGILGFIIAILLIVYGFSMMSKKRSY